MLESFVYSLKYHFLVVRKLVQRDPCCTAYDVIDVPPLGLTTYAKGKNSGVEKGLIIMLKNSEKADLAMGHWNPKGK